MLKAGARDALHLALDPKGTPHVFFDDKKALVLTTKASPAWTRTKVVDTANRAERC